MRTIIGWLDGPIPPDANAFELAVFVAAGVSDDLNAYLDENPAEIMHGM